MTRDQRPPDPAKHAVHELNELLTIIAGYAQLAAELAGSAKPMSDYLAEILRAASKAEDAARALFPSLPSTGAPRPVPTERLAPAGPATSRILLVDDENSVRRFTAAILTLNGYDVTPVGSGPEALQALESAAAPFDLLISDIVMSPMDGIRLVAEVTARWPGTAVLLISGFPGAVDIPMTEEGPRFPFLSKPFTNFELLAKVRAILTVHARR